ncbi:helix-turn-helix transcriptional regulator [Pseudomonas entomophila]|uniref:helix-turn-helix domain-containing protein n=1 Tax=Pseudomonas entomophila TaxID=312306 RepID=UPI001BCC0FD8|nr:helix-turn-helix transcriptional regulator [Pseudomonas entomophila]
MPSIRDRNLQLILDAASEEFALHGFNASRVDDIATRAGLPRANVFYTSAPSTRSLTAMLLRGLQPDRHPPSLYQ